MNTLFKILLGCAYASIPFIIDWIFGGTTGYVGYLAAVLLFFLGYASIKVEKVKKPTDEELILSFGWTKSKHSSENWPRYEKGNFVLYTGSERPSWVFDLKEGKEAPGIIARFDKPILDADLQYCDAYIKRVTT